MRRFRLKKGLMFLAFFVAAIVVFSTIVMRLWNAILPDVIGVKPITFIQAAGILLLSKILFGGFSNRGGWHGGRHNQWRNNIREKFASMTPEEREKFKFEWKNRCSSRGWRTDRKDRSGAEGE